MKGKLSAIAVTTGLLLLFALPLLLPSDGPRRNSCDRASDADCELALLAPKTPEELAQKYAPVLVLREQLHACDRSGGAYEPIPVEAVLDNPEVSLHSGFDRSVITYAPSAADLFRAPRNSYLDFPGNPTRPGCRYESDGRRYSEGEPNVAYARVTREAGGIVLQYWFFYYFNDWNNKHEGDWEMIQLVFDTTSLLEAYEQEPQQIGLSQHSGGEVALWEDDKVEKEGDRPVIYVAAGSHANFYGQHIYVGRAEGGAGFGCDDASAPGRRVTVEARLIPERVTDASDPFAWVTYRGRWGEVVGTEFDGPTGPITKDAWNDPLAWQSDLRTASLRLPSPASIGPNSIEAFCNTVAFLSNLLLPFYVELPMLSIVVFAAFSIGVIVSLTRTRYMPIQAQPLHGRRRIGQILISSVEIYRRNAGLFLTIGLIFVPVGLIVSGIHWLLLGVSPVESIVRVPGASNIAQEVALAFALSELQFGIAYAIVIAATTATLARIERRQPVSVLLAFQDFWRRLPQLALPRLLAIVIISALSLTVIALPLAFRQAVRWMFLEQAVFLDGANWKQAPGVSSATVTMDWWWSAAAAASLALFGLVFAPAVGIVVLLFATSVPLLYVNVLSSAIYVALVPYIAIALTLIYFDLKSRTEAATQGAEAEIEATD
jgi:hypothetical protein